MRRKYQRIENLELKKLELMEITEQDFYKYVPAAQNPEGYGIIEMMHSYLWRYTEKIMDDIIRSDIFDGIDKHQDEFPGLVGMIKRYICLAAFFDAIPGLDLVLTPTGFGVVRNNNVAPASRDRVRVYQTIVRLERDKALDDLISELRKVDGWADTDQAKELINSLFWNGSDTCRELGITVKILDMVLPGGREDLERAAPLITDTEIELNRILSPEFYEELVILERARNSMPHARLKHYILNFAKTYFNRDFKAAKRAELKLIGFLDKFAKLFHTYAISSAYVANHHKRYENREDSSCYFF